MFKGKESAVSHFEVSFILISWCVTLVIWALQIQTSHPCLCWGSENHMVKKGLRSEALWPSHVPSRPTFPLKSATWSSFLSNIFLVYSSNFFVRFDLPGLIISHETLNPQSVVRSKLFCTEVMKSLADGTFWISPTWATGVRLLYSNNFLHGFLNFHEFKNMKRYFILNLEIFN